MNTDKKDAREKAYSFLSRGLIDCKIHNAFLVLKTKPSIPPLIQIIDLPVDEQQLFGYLVTMGEVPTKRIRWLFDITSVEADQRLYKLVGSGLISIKSNKNKYEVVMAKIPKPTLEETELPYKSRMIIIYFRENPDTSYRLSKIGSRLNWSVQEVIQEISLLIGLGYYRGVFKGNNFHAKSNFIKPKEKPHCFECNTRLADYRKPCPNCLSKPPLCSVCRSQMSTSEELVSCKHCNNMAHKDHMMGWLKIKSICPVCRNKLTPGDLIEINPN